MLYVKVKYWAISLAHNFVTVSYYKTPKRVVVWLGIIWNTWMEWWSSLPLLASLVLEVVISYAHAITACATSGWKSRLLESTSYGKFRKLHRLENMERGQLAMRILLWIIVVLIAWFTRSYVILMKCLDGLMHQVKVERGSMKQPRVFIFLWDLEEKFTHVVKFTKLFFLTRFFCIKCLYNWSNKSFNILLQLLKEALPYRKNLPKDKYEMKKMLKELLLS